jgi:hypothetical protein
MRLENVKKELLLFKVLLIGVTWIRLWEKLCFRLCGGNG